VRARHRSRSRRPARASSTRRDIQGLRALAVVLVILDHVGGRPRGGFVGVDVFFVISGFLITTTLVSSAAQNGTSGQFFAGFYRRRARRILPAAVTVLAACWVASTLAFKGARTSQDHRDILWALGFAANIHFSRLGTDYFHAGASPSIVQHFWSLAIEEQFYLVLPVIIWLVLARAAVRRLGARTTLLGLISILTIASFVLSLHETAVEPTVAYFSPLDRAWELGAGATLALAIARWPNMSHRLTAARGPLALTGTVGIIGSAIVIRPAHGFPAPAAVVPVLATALVIAVGSGAPSKESRWNAALTNPLSSYLGDISYSLYLWHWPVIVVAASIVTPAASALYYPIVIFATLGLSIASYELVEDPFRRPGYRPRIRQNAASYRPLVAGALVAAAVVCIALRPAPALPAAVAALGTGTASVTGSSDPAAPSLAPTTAALRAQLVAALQSPTFPHLVPGLDHLGEAGAHADIWRDCDTQEQVQPSCTYGSGTKTALVYGDSISMDWVPAVRAALVPAGWTVYGFARGHRPPSARRPVEHRRDPAALRRRCPRHRGRQGVPVWPGEDDRAHQVARRRVGDPRTAAEDQVTARLRHRGRLTVQLHLAGLDPLASPVGRRSGRGQVDRHSLRRHPRLVLRPGRLLSYLRRYDADLLRRHPHDRRVRRRARTGDAASTAGRLAKPAQPVAAGLAGAMIGVTFTPSGGS
jgi:peptidoglycan/LPS O-acetylase OafA/YrhL